MGDKVKGFIVTLEADVHEDTAKDIMSAIYMIKGVIDVSPVNANPMDDHMIRQRVQLEYRRKLFDVLRSDDD